MKSRKGRPINPEAERAAEVVLANTFLGIHHVPYWDQRVECGPKGVSVTLWGELASYDFNYLTRLVIAAHDHHVRVSVTRARGTAPRAVVGRRDREGSR